MHYQTEICMEFDREAGDFGRWSDSQEKRLLQVGILYKMEWTARERKSWELANAFWHF